MARTRKRFPWVWNACFRTPRGKLQAIRAGARKGARPPDSWEDKAFDRQCWLPQRIAGKMVRQGWNPYDVIDRLVHRYGLPLMVARSVVELEMYAWKRSCPAGTVQVYRERRRKG